MLAAKFLERRAARGNEAEAPNLPTRSLTCALGGLPGRPPGGGGGGGPPKPPGGGGGGGGGGGIVGDQIMRVSDRRLHRIQKIIRSVRWIGGTWICRQRSKKTSGCEYGEVDSVGAKSPPRLSHRKKIRLPHNVTHHHSHEKSCSNSQ